MIDSPLLLLLVSHVLGDIIFASYWLALRKRRVQLFDQVVAVGCHSTIHALFAGLLIGLAAGPWLRAALLVLGFHFCIDLSRCRVEIRRFGPERLYVKRSEFIAWISGNTRDPEKMALANLWPWLLINFADQGLHLLSLYVISLLL